MLATLWHNSANTLKESVLGIQEELLTRSEGKCELCGATKGLSPFEVAPGDGSAEKSVLVCQTCLVQLENSAKVDPNHWRCLSESMWSMEPAVQVAAYRMLNRLRSEGWAQDLLESLYLEPEVQNWADALNSESADTNTPTRDSNGAVLVSGDSVTIIKDLEVKGAGFTAKQGTKVTNIHLTDNPEQIEGRVNGVKIVLLSKFLKKA